MSQEITTVRKTVLAVQALYILVIDSQRQCNYSGIVKMANVIWAEVLADDKLRSEFTILNTDFFTKELLEGYDETEEVPPYREISGKKIRESVFILQEIVDDYISAGHPEDMTGLLPQSDDSTPNVRRVIKPCLEGLVNYILVEFLSKVNFTSPQSGGMMAPPLNLIQSAREWDIDARNKTREGKI